MENTKKSGQDSNMQRIIVHHFNLEDTLLLSTISSDKKAWILEKYTASEKLVKSIGLFPRGFEGSSKVIYMNEIVPKNSLIDIFQSKEPKTE